MRIYAYVNRVNTYTKCKRIIHTHTWKHTYICTHIYFFFLSFNVQTCLEVNSERRSKEKRVINERPLLARL